MTVTPNSVIIPLLATLLITATTPSVHAEPQRYVVHDLRVPIHMTFVRAFADERGARTIALGANGSIAAILGAGRIEPHLVQPAQLAGESRTHRIIVVLLSASRVAFFEHRASTLTSFEVTAPTSQVLRCTAQLLGPMPVIDMHVLPAVDEPAKSVSP